MSDTLLPAPGTAADKISLDTIYEDAALSPRLKLCPSQITQFSAIMRERGIERFPAVVLGAPGEDGRHPIVDGRHRIAAARLAEETAIQASVLPPMSGRDLFAEAVRLSSAHGPKLNTE